MGEIGVRVTVNGRPANSGETIPPGSSLVFQGHRDGNTDAVPDGALTYRLGLNGKVYNPSEFSQFTTAKIPHTQTRKAIGFTLKDDVRGMVEVSVEGEVNRRWAFPIQRIDREGSAIEIEIRASLARIEHHLGIVK